MKWKLAIVALALACGCGEPPKPPAPARANPAPAARVETPRPSAVHAVLEEEPVTDPVQATNQTVITSKRMSYDYPKRMAVFEDEVVVEDPQVHITADTITATFDTNNAPEMVTAVGHVRIVQKDRVATGGRAGYSVRTGLLVLTVKPRIWRGNDVLEGSRILFNRDDDKVTCENPRLWIVSGSGGFGQMLNF